MWADLYSLTFSEVSRPSDADINIRQVELLCPKLLRNQIYAFLLFATKLSENFSVDTIVCSFGTGIHSGTSLEKTCGFAFDVSGNVLAHAFLPEDGRIHFDEDENWTSNTGPGVNLLAIALHEIGLVLGMDHTGVNGVVMHAIAKEGENAVRKLHSDDIAGIRELYGKKSPFS